MMVMYISKEMCTGCGACKNICPSQCIEMKYDEEGFLYPNVNMSKCIHCRQCEQVCPMTDSFKKDKVVNRLPVSDCYISYTKELKFRKTTASGGISTALGSMVLKRGGVICGAEMTNDFRVVHKIIKSYDDLFCISGSKYVQSDTERTFQEVKSLLDNQVEVMYTGTGCQIAGLKAFLGQDRENLCCIDITCTGVTPPQLFRKYIEGCHSSKVKQMVFHAKDKGWEKYSVRFDFEDGKTVIESGYENLYTVGFLSGMYLRPSCYHCNFRGKNSLADITLGDAWKMYHGKYGACMVLVNTQKGQNLWNNISDTLHFEEICLDYLMKSNGYYLTKSARKPKYRNACIFHLMNSKQSKLAFRLWCGKGKASKWLRKQ